MEQCNAILLKLVLPGYILSVWYQCAHCLFKADMSLMLRPWLKSHQLTKHTFYPWYFWSFSLEIHMLESEPGRRGFDKEQARQEMSYEESKESMKGARSEVEELQADAVNWWLWICILSFLWIIKHSAVILLPNQHTMSLMAIETCDTDLPLRHQTFDIKKSHQNNVTLDTRSSWGVCAHVCVGEWPLQLQACLDSSGARMWKSQPEGERRCFRTALNLTWGVWALPKIQPEYQTCKWSHWTFQHPQLSHMC